MKLIDKSALVAEIKRLREDEYPCDTFEESTGYYNALDEITTFINTLEVKEVDLDKEIDLVEDKYHGFESLSRADIIGVAKYFFELGLKVAQKEEPISEDLKDYADKYAAETCQLMVIAGEYDDNSFEEYLMQACIDSANWQKKQIMKDAIDCFVGPREGWFYIGPLIPQHYYNLEKDEEIKMVIIKE